MQQELCVKEQGLESRLREMEESSKNSSAGLTRLLLAQQKTISRYKDEAKNLTQAFQQKLNSLRWTLTWHAQIPQKYCLARKKSLLLLLVFRVSDLDRPLSIKNWSVTHPAQLNRCERYSEHPITVETCYCSCIFSLYWDSHYHITSLLITYNVNLLTKARQVWIAASGRLS